MGRESPERGGNCRFERACVTVANNAKRAGPLACASTDVCLDDRRLPFHNAHIESISQKDTIPGTPEAGSAKRRLSVRVLTCCRQTGWSRTV
jgi:hypothetical protein